MSQAEAAPVEDNLQGPRAPRLSERDAVIAMLDYVFRISQGRASSIGIDWPLVYTPENLRNIHVIFDVGAAEGPKPVASAGVWVSDVVLGQTSLRVGGINAVGTLHEYRKHGLGERVMAAAKQTMLDQGCAVGLLSTGIANWYRRMGWEWAGSVRNYALNRGNVALLPSLRPGVNMRIVQAAGEWDALDEAILHLYHQANLGRRRTLAQFRQLATAKPVQHLVIAEEAGEPTAYLLVQENRIIEWAGRAGDKGNVDINKITGNMQAATDIMALARAYFEAMDNPTASATLRASDSGGAALLRTMIIQTPDRGFQHPIVTQLDTIGIPYSIEYLGMVYLVDPQSIIDAFGLSSQVQITPLAPKHVPNQSPDQFLVQTPSVNMELGRGALTKLFFGPERIRRDAHQGVEPELFAQTIFPLPLWQWTLERV